MFQKVDSYVIYDRFALEIAPKKNFLFDLGKIDLPRITHVISDRNSNSKCHLYIDYEMVALNPPPLSLSFQKLK